MKILRTFFFLLLLVNLALAAYWILGPKEAEVPNAEVSGQMHPELIKLLPEEGAAAASLLRDSDAVAQSEPSNSTPSELQSVPVIPVSSTICRTYTGIDAGMAALLMSQAHSLGDAVVVREARGQESGPTRFWVNIPPRGGKPGAEQRLAMLRSKGLDDLLIVNESGDDQYAISLGLYSTERLAQLRMEVLKEKGVENARVTRRDPSVNIRVELDGPAELIDGLEKEMGADLARATRSKCRG